MDQVQSERRQRSPISVVAHQRTIERQEKTRKLQEDSDKYQALLVDPLTNLPSRFALDEIIDRFDPNDYPPDSDIIVVYIDLKGVKQINDSLGSDAGDLYIGRCGQKLKHVFRTGKNQDVLARNIDNSENNLHKKNFTGDEFIAIAVCSHTDIKKATSTIDNRLRNLNNNNLNSDGRTDSKIVFRHGIVSSKISQITPDYHISFKKLIKQAENELNKKRQLEINPSER